MGRESRGQTSFGRARGRLGLGRIAVELMEKLSGTGHGAAHLYCRHLGHLGRRLTS